MCNDDPPIRWYTHVKTRGKASKIGRDCCTSECEAMTCFQWQVGTPRAGLDVPLAADGEALGSSRRRDRGRVNYMSDTEKREWIRYFGNADEYFFASESSLSTSLFR